MGESSACRAGYDVHASQSCTDARLRSIILYLFRAYSTNKHGMIQGDIEALSHFFEGDWRSVKGIIGLTVSDRTQALVWSGTLLCAANKYKIGRPLLEDGIQMVKDDRNFVTAARSARNLSYMCALHGELDDAKRFSEESVEYASKTPKFRYKMIEILNGVQVNSRFQLMASHVTLGYVLHHLGRFHEAQESFHAGEKVHATECRRYPELRTVWCQRYCDFLIDTGRAQEAYERAERALRDPEEPRGWGEGAFAVPVVTLAHVKAATRLYEAGRVTHAIDELMDMLDVAEGQCTGGDERTTSEKANAKSADEKGAKMTWIRPVFRVARARLLRHQRRYIDARAEIEKAKLSETSAG